MPKWKDYKAEAKSRGALAQEFFVAISTPIAEPERVKATLPDHLEYQARLEAEGSLFLAGPLSDETGDLMEGVGQIIYRAHTLEDARKLADADPMHARNVRAYVLRRWLVNEGSLQLSLRFAAQSAAME